MLRQQLSHSASRCRTISRFCRRESLPRAKLARREKSGCSGCLSILRFTLGHSVKANGQQLPREGRETAVGDLANAGSSVAHLLGYLGGTVAETVAQPEQRPAARGKPTEHAVEV